MAHRSGIEQLFGGFADQFVSDCHPVCCHNISAENSAENDAPCTKLPRLTVVPSARARKHIVPDSLSDSTQLPVSMQAKSQVTQPASDCDTSLLVTSAHDHVINNVEAVRCTHEHPDTAQSDQWKHASAPTHQGCTHEEATADPMHNGVLVENPRQAIAKRLHIALSVRKSTRLKVQARSSRIKRSENKKNSVQNTERAKQSIDCCDSDKTVAKNVPCKPWDTDDRNVRPTLMRLYEELLQVQFTLDCCALPNGSN